MRFLIITFLIFSNFLSAQSLGIRGGFVQYGTEEVHAAVGSSLGAYVNFDSITSHSEIQIAVEFQDFQGYSKWLESDVNISGGNIQLAWQEIIPMGTRFRLLAGASVNYLTTTTRYIRQGLVFKNHINHLALGVYGGLRYGKTTDTPLVFELIAGPAFFVLEEWDVIPYFVNVQVGIAYYLRKS